MPYEEKSVNRLKEAGIGQYLKQAKVIDKMVKSKLHSFFVWIRFSGHPSHTIDGGSSPTCVLLIVWR